MESCSHSLPKSSAIACWSLSDLIIVRIRLRRCDRSGPIADSRRGFWHALRPYQGLTEAWVHAAPAQSVASSAVRRLRERVDDYSPPGLEGYLSDPDPTPVTEQGPVPDPVG